MHVVRRTFVLLPPAGNSVAICHESVDGNTILGICGWALPILLDPRQIQFALKLYF